MAAHLAKHATVFSRNYCRLARLLITEKNSRLPWTIGVRHHARWFRPMLLKLNNQIKSIEQKYGKEKPKPRSHKENWNYESELFAFSKRIGEEFNSQTIRTAFTHVSHVENKETVQHKDDAMLPAEHNEMLAQIGSVFVSDYIKAYLRLVYPRLPDEGIDGLHDYLVSYKVLLYIARNLGLCDLILCEKYPIPGDVLHTTFLAVIGAIVKDQGLERGGQFVCDFIITQLISQDIGALCHYEDPTGLLTDILKEEGRGPPESRLLREVGRNTVTAMYMVGIYSDKKLLGWAPGQTVEAAEEEATRVSLKKMFGTPENQPPLPLDSTKSNINEAVIRTLKNKVDQRAVAGQ